MKKVLIITYYWPPSGGAGVQRWLKFTKYLRNYGWEPVIYTAENPEMPEKDESLFHDVPKGITVIKTKIWEPYLIYKIFTGKPKSSKVAAGFLREKKKNPFLEKIAIWIRGNLFIPDARKYWIKPSVRYLINYLKNNPVDIIISTGPPHSCHLIARNLKRKLNIPWLADFRDPWTKIDFINELKLSKHSLNIHKKLEYSVLKESDKTLVISNQMAIEFNYIFNKEYTILTNGFDTDDFKIPEDISLDKEFSIAHIGTLVPARNPSILWQALELLIKENHPLKNNLKIKLIGKVDFSVIEELKKRDLFRFANIIDYIPHKEAIIEQCKSIILLLIINNTPNSKGILTGKVFEYLSSERPIMCIGPEDGDIAGLIDITGNSVCIGYDNIQKMKISLMQYYDQFINDNLPKSNGNILKYSRENLTKNLVIQLEEILSNSAFH